VRRFLALFPLALLAAGCFGGGGESTLTLGIASEPTSLDGALAPDAESRRVIAQLFEGLVALEQGTTKITPKLAATWSADRSGRVWTFRLREGVRFQDGTPLTGAAVCANFERWHRLTGAQRDLSASYYWQRVFGGFSGQRSLYGKCTWRELSVDLHLTRPSAAFLSALPLPAFSIASPRSLLLHDPVGTGPFRVQSWTRGDRLVLVRNDDYWGERPKLAKLVFRVIPADDDRLAALERGEIDGTDVVGRDVPEVLRELDLQLLERPPNNVGYLTINGARAPMDKPLVRKAVALGLDRRRLAGTIQPHGSAVVASLFQPAQVFGTPNAVAAYPYRPAESRRLLRLAGLTPPVPIELWYPSSVSRPYLPDPAGAFAILAAGLEKAGFKVTARTAPWNGDYLVRVDKGDAGHLNLVGWTGDFADPDDFLGTLFSRPTRQFGFSDAKLFALLERAEREPVRTQRALLYRQANERVLDLVPAVPLLHTPEFVALRSNVQGYVASSFGPEVYSGVSLRG
jgi:peptide/nickel transport system substrate-binding protein